MFGISFSEIILIFVIAIIIFGPNQIPQITAKAGQFIFTMRHFLFKLKQDIYQQSGFNEFNQTKQDLLSTYQQLKSSVTTSVNYIHPELLPDIELYQPELDFDGEPELF